MCLRGADQTLATPAAFDLDTHLTDTIRRVNDLELLLTDAMAESRSVITEVRSVLTRHREDLNAAPVTTSTHSTVPSLVTAHNSVPQDAGTSVCSVCHARFPDEGV
jgi:ABC-type transporter Mla subunit MlaD